jgi:hypothetical protein
VLRSQLVQWLLPTGGSHYAVTRVCPSASPVYGRRVRARDDDHVGRS